MRRSPFFGEVGEAALSKPEDRAPPWPRPTLTPQKAKRRRATSLNGARRLVVDGVDDSAVDDPASVSALGALRKGSFEPVVDAVAPPHTLLLGTQPSDNSLEHGRYFMTNQNAFWWIVGDALGFRRDFHIGARTEAIGSILPHLMHEETVSYEEAVLRLTSRGFAMWDIVASSERRGSLDSQIRCADYADVRTLLERYPTITRICFSTGAGSAKIFAKAHAEWLAQAGAFRVRDDELSSAVFARHVPLTAPKGRVELCVMLSVSPAANPRPTWTAAAQHTKGFDDEWVARPAATYPFKRQQWFDVCFANEPAVREAPKWGELESHFRVDEDKSGGGGKC